MTDKHTLRQDYWFDEDGGLLLLELLGVNVVRGHGGGIRIGQNETPDADTTQSQTRGIALLGQGICYLARSMGQSETNRRSYGVVFRCRILIGPRSRLTRSLVAF